MNSNKDLVLNIFYFLFCVIAGLFLAQFLALVALLPFHDFELAVLVGKINNPLANPEMKIQMLCIQGISSFVAFVLVPLLFIIWKEQYWRSFLSTNTNNRYLLILPTVLLVLVVLPFVSYLVQWNESLVLPDFMLQFEIWAKEKEEFLKKVTQVMTKLDSPFELMLGLVVIAMLPALGEELVFRGYLQNKFVQLFGSVHVAIWLSAFLFSAIHFQFYGFVPRMVLGAIFGYLYLFTGQFHLPVIAHFTNNGLMLLMIYLKNKEYIKYDIESEENVTMSVAALSFAMMSVVLVLIMRQIKINRLKN
jgi:membrane protease YdiL (CAAX protease family)